jgi:hypothetical protein
MPSGNNNALNQLQQQQQAALSAGGAAIQQQFGQTFTPQYYQNLETNVENQQMPQLLSQYRQTGQATNYNLADKGLSQSSTAQNLGSSLQSQLAQGEQQVVNNAQQAAQTQQENVANQESQLYGQLQVSQNPTQTAQAAANAAAETSAPSVVAPLGNMFSNWTNLYLANQTANTANTQNELALALYAPYLNQLSQNSGALPTNQ